MKVGYASSIVTPPVGVHLSGYASRVQPSENVHDNLMCRALYFEDDGEVFAIAVLDLIGVSFELLNDFQNLTSKMLNIDKSRLTIAATHTHAGPELNQELSRYIARVAAGTVYMASRRLEEVQLYSGVGSAGAIIVNRRNPSSGLLDPRVHVVSFKYGSAYKALLVNFTCHAVVMGHNNLQISADYPGALNRYVEILTGGSSLFVNGTCGDVNPLTPKTDLTRVYDRSIGTFEDVEWMGRILACESVKTAELSAFETPNLRAKNSIVKVKIWKPLTVGEARQELEALEKSKESSDAYRRYIVEAKIRVLEKFKDVEYLDLPITVLTLSDSTALVMLPSEILVEVGLKIKESSPFKNTLVAGYCNGYLGYIPVEKAYDEGGYEATFPTCIVERGTGEKLIEESLRLLSRIR
ncbi:hypothetical protein KEJ27_07300 [Candidatus Bathyarchaeota archaeon]|nr:hypothetical protein [Candidatus Bathyarchaeota archaeon]MBS7613216.1 hypothetical protein [Candidatus Bathyarchaeota archaeon]MBS7617262.1 hypothetical protein [Candidatus Bathyarchaeota archaeon]